MSLLYKSNEPTSFLNSLKTGKSTVNIAKSALSANKNQQ